MRQAGIIHNGKYSYDNFVYVNSVTKGLITCPIHGNFEQQPSGHLNGKNCQKCAIETQTKTKEEFVIQAIAVHDGKYSYDNLVYLHTNIKGVISCPIHGDFEQQPANHLRGKGCPKCTTRVSKIGTIWLDILNVPVREHSIKLSSGKRYTVDGYDPTSNTVYEFNGDFWHGNPDIFDPNGFNKTAKKTYGELYQNTLTKQKHLEEAGYNVVSIWEKDFNEQYKDQIQERKNKTLICESTETQTKSNDVFDTLFSF